MNVLPMLALSAVAAGYFGAVDIADKYINTQPQAALTSYPASPHLTVHDLMERAPQSVDQPFCDQTAKVAETLAHDFAETEQNNWVQGGDMKLQLWGSEVMGTWTLLHVGNDDIACVVSSGTGWAEGMVPDDVLALSDIVNS